MVTKLTRNKTELFLTALVFLLLLNLSCTKRGALSLAEETESEVDECVDRTEDGAYTGQFCSTTTHYSTGAALPDTSPAPSPSPTPETEECLSTPEDVTPRFELGADNICRFCRPLWTSANCLERIACDSVDRQLCTTPPDGYEVDDVGFSCPSGTERVCNSVGTECSCHLEEHVVVDCFQEPCPTPSATPSPSVSPNPSATPNPSPIPGDYHADQPLGDSCKYDSTYAKQVCDIWSTYVKDNPNQDFRKFVNKTKHKKKGTKDKLVVFTEKGKAKVIHKPNGTVTRRTVTYNPDGSKTKTKSKTKKNGKTKFKSKTKGK